MSRAGALPEHRPTPLQIVAWAVLLIVILALYARGVGSFQVGVYQDDAEYLVLSHSIAFGEQYGLVHGPGPARPSKYPFVFPLLLSPFALPPAAAGHDMGATGETPESHLIRATAVPLAATLINVSLLFWGWPLLSRTSRWWGLGVASLHGLSPVVTGHARMIMSEPVFLTFLLTVFLLTELCAREPARLWCAVGLGAAIAAAVFTRTIGVTVAVAAVVRLAALAFTGAPRHAPAAPVRTFGLLALGAVLFVGCAVASTSVRLRDLGMRPYADELLADASQTGRNPTEELTGQLARVARGYLIDQMRNIVLPVGGGERTRAWAERIGIGDAPTWLGAAVVGAVLIGIWQSGRRRLLAPTVLLFEAAYVAAIMLWPWDHARYLYPLQPFLQFQFLVGVASLGALASRRELSSPHRLSAGTAAVVGLALVLCSAWKSLEVRNTRQFTRDLSVGTAWLARHAPPDAIVMARYPKEIYLYSGRATVELAAAGTAAEAEQLLAGSPADYVLVAPYLTWGADSSAAYGQQEDAALAALADMASHGRAELVFQSAPDKVVVYALRTSRS